MIWPVLLATVALLGSLITYGMAAALIVHLGVRLFRAGYTALVFWKNVAVMSIVSLVTAAAHLLQIALWAGVYLLCGEISSPEKAFYFSAENYTSLGYGDITLSERWRLLGPLEAVNGLLLFGLSTALMFAAMSHLIVNRLHHLGLVSIEPVPTSVPGRTESR